MGQPRGTAHIPGMMIEVTGTNVSCVTTPLTQTRYFPEVQPRERLPLVLLVLLTVIWLVLAIDPVNRQDWLLENILVLLSVPLLVVTRHRMRFSHGAYVCLFIFFVLHSIGAHYTYSLVPYDRWWQTLTGSTLNQMLGWERNHYDRLLHFLYGVLLLQPAAELLARYAPTRGMWQRVIPVLFIMSQAAIFELVEWIAALIVAPELGNAYLGTQGDPWDAQQDMALATLGAIVTTVLMQLSRQQQRHC
jgi:putative membrane protein